MHFPIGTILWAGNNSKHLDHLHVEPPSIFIGYTDGRGEQPPAHNPGMSSGVQEIYRALIREFGEGDYFIDPEPDTEWTHMGWYNRRPIAGSLRWSQHAWGNAIDIGPYYGVNEQRKFFDFLTGKHMDYEIIAGIKWYDVDKWADWADASIRKNIVAGIIRGRPYKDGRIFDPEAPLSRQEAAILLDRIEAV